MYNEMQNLTVQSQGEEETPLLHQPEAHEEVKFNIGKLSPQNKVIIKPQEIEEAKNKFRNIRSKTFRKKINVSEDMISFNNDHSQSKAAIRLVDQITGPELIDEVLDYKIKKHNQEYIEAWNEGSRKMRLIRRIAFGPFYIAFIIGALLLMCFHTVELHPQPIGSWASSTGLNFNLNISNCMVHIRDIDSADGITNAVKIQRPNPLFHSSEFLIEGGNEIMGTVNLNVSNPFDMEYCNVTLFIDPTQTINDFNLSCSSCVLIQDTLVFNVGGITTINSQSISANLAYLNTTNLQFKANQGSLQVNMINTYSTIQNNITFVRKGDIILQSDSTINVVKFTSPTQTYCFAGQLQLNSCTTSSGSTHGSCRVLDINNSTGSTQIFNLYSKQGNIYVNVIPGIQQPILPTVTMANNSGQMFFNPIYNNIGFDNYTNSQLYDYEELVQNPTIYVPILIINFGDYKSLSSTWTKWILASNVTYEYIKPWILASISGTLLRSYEYEVNGQLLPGLCPWRPTLSTLDYFSIYTLIDNFRSKLQLVTDVAFVDDSEFNPDSSEMVNYTTSSGIYNIVNDWMPWGDNWYTLNQDENGNIIAQKHNIDENLQGFVTLILSLVCAILIGIVGLTGIIYVINHYTYTVISKGAKKSAYININTIQSKELASEIKEMIKITQSIEGKTIADKIEQPARSVSLIYNLSYLFQNFIYISAFIDYFVVSIAKMRTNSIDNFFKILFVKESEASSPQAIKEDSINFEDFQNLYQEYCFLSHFTEQSIEIKFIKEDLKKRGLIVDIIEDSTTTAFCGIILKDMKGIKLSACNHDLDSLTIFMKQGVEQTRFDQDVVEIGEFIATYREFCKFFRLLPILTTAQALKQNYGIETTKIPKYIIRKENEKKEGENYIIDRRNLTIHLRYLSDDLIGLTDEEIKRVKGSIWGQDSFIYEFLAIIIQYSFVLLLAFPFVCWIILLNTAYSPFTLKNNFYLLDWESFYYQPSVAFTHLPYPIQAFFIFITVLNGVDLMFYINIMERPIESCFKTNEWTKDIWGRRIALAHWIIVLILLFSYVSYIALVMVWTLLGAIINPSYMLPYAAGTFTFITFSTTKFQQFKETIERGKSAILAYIEKNFGEYINKILIKLGINLMQIENEVLHKAKDITSSKAFKESTEKLIESGVISKHDIESVHKKITDLNSHDTSGDIMEVANNMEQHPQVLKNEFEKLATTIEDKYISKMKTDLAHKECPENLINIVISLATKKNDDLRNLIISYLKHSSTDIPETMKLFLSEVIFSTASTIRDKNIKFLSKKFIHSIISILSDSKGINKKLTNSLVNLYYGLREFEKDQWEEFGESLTNVIRQNEKFAVLNNYHTSSVKLILATLKLILVFIAKNSSKKEIGEKLTEFIKLIRDDTTFDNVQVKELNESSSEDDTEYINECDRFSNNAIINIIHLLKHEELLWDNTGNSIASVDDVYKFCTKSLAIFRLRTEKLNEVKNDIMRYKEKVGGMINISIGLLRNDLQKIHSKSISTFNNLYKLRYYENDKKISDSYLKLLLDLYSVSMTDPDEFMKKAFDYGKDNMDEELKEFILYSITYKYRAALISPLKITDDNKYLDMFLKRGSIHFAYLASMLGWISDQCYRENNIDNFLDSTINCLSILDLNNRIRNYLRDSIILLITQKSSTASMCIRNLRLPLEKFILVGKGFITVDCISRSDFEELINLCGDKVDKNLLHEKFAKINKNLKRDEWKSKVLKVLEDHYRSKDPDAAEHKPKKLFENDFRDLYITMQKLQSYLYIEPKNLEELRKILIALSAYVLDSFDSEDNEILRLLKVDNLLKNIYTIISLKCWMNVNGEYPKKVDKRMIDAVNQISDLINIDPNYLIHVFQLFFIDDLKCYDYSLQYFFGLITPKEKGYINYVFQKVENLKHFATTLLNKVPDILKWTEKAIDQEIHASRHVTTINLPDNEMNNDKKNDDNLANKSTEKDIIDIEVPASWCRDFMFNINNQSEPSELQESLRFINTMMKTSKKMCKFANSDTFEKSELFQDLCSLADLYKGLGSAPELKSTLTENLIYLLSTSKKCDALKRLMRFFKDINNPICMSLTIYAIMKGWGDQIVHDAQTFKDIAGQQFEVKPEFFDIFEAIVKKEIPGYVQCCSRIIRDIKGSSYFDKQFIISALSFMNNQFFNFSPIAQQVGCNAELLEFVTILYRLRNPKKRTKAFEQMENSVTTQKIFKDLGIEYREFISIARIIFNEFNHKYSMDQALKAIDCRKLVDHKFIQCINQFFYDRIDPEEEMESFTQASNKFNLKKVKLNPLFEILDLDPNISYLMTALRRGNFLILENQIQDFEWVFGPASIDYHKNELIISPEGRHLVDLTQGLAGLVNSHVEFTKLPYDNYCPKANSLNYALKLVSEELRIDSKWLVYGMLTSNPDQINGLEYNLSLNHDNVLAITLLSKMTDIIAVQKDILGLCDWHGAMIYFYKYDLLKEHVDHPYLQILENSSDALKNLTIELFTIDKSKKLASIFEKLIPKSKSKLEGSNTVNKYLADGLMKNIKEIIKLPEFSKYLKKKYDFDSDILYKFTKDKEGISLSPIELFKSLEESCINNRIIILLIKCLIPYLFEKLIDNPTESFVNHESKSQHHPHSESKLKKNNMAFLNLAIITGIMEIRTIENTKKKYPRNIFSLNLLMSNIERKIIFIDFEVAKLYRKFSVMKLVGLSRGLMVSNASEILLSPPLLDICQVRKLSFFNYTNNKVESQKSTQTYQKEAKIFFERYNLAELNFGGDPSKLVHGQYTCNYCDYLLPPQSQNTKEQSNQEDLLDSNLTSAKSDDNNKHHKSNEDYNSGPIKGPRYRCIDCENIDFCYNCTQKLIDIFKNTPQGRKPKQVFQCNNKQVVHKPKHQLLEITTNLDSLSTNHIIRTYYTRNIQFSQNCESGNELFGDVLRKRSWSEIRFDDIELSKLITLNPRLFSSNKEMLTERLENLEISSNYLFEYLRSLHAKPTKINKDKENEDSKKQENNEDQKIEKEENCQNEEISQSAEEDEKEEESDDINKDDALSKGNFSAKLFNFLIEELKNEENILLYPSYEVKCQKFIMKIKKNETQFKDKKYDIIVDELLEKNEKFDEQYLDLRTKLTYKSLEGRMKDFETAIMKSNSLMLMDLFEDKFDFTKHQDKNYLTIRGSDSRHTNQLILRFIGLRRNSRHLEELNSLFSKGSYLNSDQKILEEIIAFLVKPDDNRFLESMKGIFDLTEKTIDILNICSNYISFKADNINNIKRTDLVNTVPKKAYSAIKRISRRMEQPEIICLLHSIFNFNLGMIIITFVFRIYSLQLPFLDALYLLADRLTSGKNKTGMNKLKDLLSSINFKSLNAHFLSGSYVETSDYTQIPNLIDFKGLSGDVRMDLLPYLLSKFIGEKAQVTEDGIVTYNQKLGFFVCRALNRMLECTSDQIDKILLKLFTTNYETITQMSFIYISSNKILEISTDDIVITFKHNFNALLHSFTNYDDLSDIKSLEMDTKDTHMLKIYSWLLYLKTDCFNNFDEKQKYADIIYKIAEESNNKDYQNPLVIETANYYQNYILTFISYIKWDIHMIFNCLDQNTKSFAILSALYLLLNWNRVLVSIYQKHQEEFSISNLYIDNSREGFSNDKIEFEIGSQKKMPNEELKAHLDRCKDILKNEINPYSEYFSIIFNIASSKIHSNKKDTLDSDYLKDKLSKMNEFGKNVKYCIENLKNIPISGTLDGLEKSQTINDVVIKMRSKITQIQMYETWLDVYSKRRSSEEESDVFGQNEDESDVFGQNEEENEDKDKDKEENEEKVSDDDDDDDDEVGFENMIKNIFCLEDFFLLNFDKLLKSSTGPRVDIYDWIFFNNYVLIAEHYNSITYFNSSLKRKPYEAGLPFIPDQIYENIMQLTNLARDCCNKSEEYKDRNLEIFSDILGLMLKNLCCKIPEDHQKDCRILIKEITKLFSSISGYNFLECFESQCKEENRLECKHCTHKSLDHVALHISKAIKAIINSKKVLNIKQSLTKRKEGLEELIPLLLDIEHNKDKDTWTIILDILADSRYDDPNILHQYQSMIYDDGDNNSETHIGFHRESSTLSTTLQSGNSIMGVHRDNSSIFGFHREKSKIESESANIIIKTAITFGQFKDFINEVFKLLEVLVFKLKQEIHDDNSMPKVFKWIFKYAEGIFTKTIYKLERPDNTLIFDKQQSDNISKKISELGKAVVALYKLKIEDLSDIQTLVEYSVKNKEKAKNIVEYIYETLNLIDLQSFKNMIKITPKPINSQTIDDVKDLIKKVKSGKASEYDLFRMCDSLGDSSGGIGPKEFSILARRMGTPLTKHRVQEIYTAIKGPSVSSREELDFNEEEFAKALLYLKEQQILKALEFMGITPQIMFITLAYLLLLLLVIFCFIFLGIQAFAVGGSFSAVINSALPAISALAIGGHDETKKKLDEDNVKEVCEKSKAVIVQSIDKK